MTTTAKEQRAQDRQLKAAEKRAKRLGQYVRVTDEHGELWTIPPGSRLHVQLINDEDLGYKQHVVPRVLIRDPHAELDLFDLSQAVRRTTALAERTTVPQVKQLLGEQFARLTSWASFLERTRA